MEVRGNPNVLVRNNPKYQTDKFPMNEQQEKELIELFKGTNNN